MSEELQTVAERAESFKEQLQTVEETQKLIDRTLTKIHECLLKPNRNGERSDDFETLFPDLQNLFSDVEYIWFTLPERVKCLSVGFRFKQFDNPQTNREHELRQLQFLLKKIGIQEKDGVFEGELVVRPPYLPEELRRMSHGSQARSLSLKAVETLKVSRSSELNVLVVKPYGAAEGEAKIPFLKAIDFRVPFAQIEYIRLETEKRPLTTWAERDDRGGFQIKQAIY